MSKLTVATTRTYQIVRSEDFEDYISQRWQIKFSVSQDEHVPVGSHLAYHDINDRITRFERTDLANFQVGKLAVGTRFTETLLKQAVADGDLPAGNVLIFVTK